MIYGPNQQQVTHVIQENETNYHIAPVPAEPSYILLTGKGDNDICFKWERRVWIFFLWDMVLIKFKDSIAAKA